MAGLGEHPGLQPEVGAPAYQDGGDDQRGVEETIGRVGGVEAAVHTEAICHVPLANLRRPRRKAGRRREARLTAGERPGGAGALAPGQPQKLEEAA